MVLALLSLLPALSHAADPGAAENKAASLFKAGAEAHRKGDYLGAARFFDAAHAQVPSAAALYNAGRAWQKAGQPAPAADRFREALKRGNFDPAQMEDAKRRLAALRRLVTQLDVSGSADGTLSVAHVTGAALPVTVHVPAGEVHLYVTWLAGGTSARTLRTEKGERVAVFVEAPRPERPDSQRVPAAGTQEPPSAANKSSASNLGFFFRFALGPGLLWDSLEQSLSGGFKAEGSAVGGILENELAIGMTVNQSLAFGLAASTAFISEPEVEFPSDPDLDRIGTGVLVLTGPFVIWYVRQNVGWHVQGMLGGAALHLSDAEGSPIDNRILGSGLLAGVGYDWWLSKHWRSGVMLRATAAALESERTQHSVFLLSLQGSLTWDGTGRPR